MKTFPDYVTPPDGRLADTSFVQPLAYGGLNTGHGHVFPRPDGKKARCGGPKLCNLCAADQVRKTIPTVAFTGTPVAPTPETGTSTTQRADIDMYYGDDIRAMPDARVLADTLKYASLGNSVRWKIAHAERNRRLNAAEATILALTLPHGGRG